MADATAAHRMSRWSSSGVALAAACLLLCLLYAADTLMVSLSLHWYQRNPSSGQLMLVTELERVQQRLQRRDWLSGLLHFGFPAVCYCVSNNLSFYALQLLPAYTYMLLTSPKVSAVAKSVL
mgnify:CR=1 FL=1